MRRVIVAGLIILISISPLFRGLYFAYETYGFLTAIALLCILYFINKIRCGEQVYISKLFLPLALVLVAASALSFINAANPRENLGLLLLYCELLVLFIILYDHFFNRQQNFIRYLMMSVVFAGAVCATMSLISLTGRFNVLEMTNLFNRLGSTFQYANTAAIYFVICLIFAITLVTTEKNALIRALVTGFGGIFIYAFFMTGSRGGYIVLILIIPLLLLLLPSIKSIESILCLLVMTVPVFFTIKSFSLAVAQKDNLRACLSLMESFLLSLAIYLIFHFVYRVIVKNSEVTIPKCIKPLLGIFLVICLVCIGVFRNEIIQLLPDVMANRLIKLITDGFYDINVLNRYHYNIDALKLISRNWLIGLGGGGWKAMYQSVQDYSYTAAFTHNHYFQVFVENGILGFISFISIIAISVIGCIYSYAKSKNTVARTYITGLFCALISLTVHAAGDFDLSFVSLMLLLWAMFAACLAGGKVSTTVNGAASKVVVVAVCSILLSFYGMYFLGAYNENIGFKHNQKRDYLAAVTYYEEANRFDPANSFYQFELAKLYHYFGRASKDSEAREQWLDKARQVSERSVDGCKNYPAYIITLVKIYHDSGMPLDALDVSQKLVECQKYNAEVYELMARSYLEAAKYYKSKGETENARELLKNCINIDQNPYLRRSGITKPQDIDSEKILSKYKHSKKLAGYLEEASNMLENIS